MDIAMQWMGLCGVQVCESSVLAFFLQDRKESQEWRGLLVDWERQ